MLNFATLALNQLFDEECPRRIARISLLGIGFDHDTAVYYGPVVYLMLGGVVGMDTVRHVGRYEERLSNGSRIGLR